MAKKSRFHYTEKETIAANSNGNNGKLNEVLTISKITKIVLFREDSGYFQIDMNCMKIVNNKMQVFKTHGIFRHGIKLWHREMEYTKCKTIRSRTVFKLFL